MAASAGGLQALSRVLAGLPHDFPLPIVIVQHLLATHPSLLAEILGRRTPLRVQEAHEGDALAAGSVFTAPPGRHVLVCADGSLALSSGELVNHCRPSADVLLESVASQFGPRAVAVILSGTGADGSAGVRAIKAAHGTVIAQEEATCEFSGMPSAAVGTSCVDYILRLDEIPARLIDFARSIAP